MIEVTRSSCDPTCSFPTPPTATETTHSHTNPPPDIANASSIQSSCANNVFTSHSHAYISTSLPSSPSTGSNPAETFDTAFRFLRSEPVCIGRELDNQVIGELGTLAISGFMGLFLWLLFAFVRPRFRQVYAVREWFVERHLRPKPLSTGAFSFLFPPIPSCPPVPKNIDMLDPQVLPSDQELMQRIIWLVLTFSLGWTFLGLAAGLPLYLVGTPCLARSDVRPLFGGQLSLLQDLSLLRLLVLLNSQDTAVSPVVGMEVTNINELSAKAETRLLALTVIVIVLSVLPVVLKLRKEYDKLVMNRETWLRIKCEGLDLAWLSIQNAPGFQGWGEHKMREFLHGIGLGPELITARTKQNVTSTEEQTSHPEITGIFTIVDTASLQALIAERAEALHRLEEAETRYIASFRMITPEPSVTEDLPSTTQNKPYISRPRMLAGTMGAIQRHKRQELDAQSTAPSSFVAPSPYYRLRDLRQQIIEGPADRSPFGGAVHERITGSRFREMNRDSANFDPIPLGSTLQMGEMEPIPEDDTNPTERKGMTTHQSSTLPPGKIDEFLTPIHRFDINPPSERESFPMRVTSRSRPPNPPHLRTQTDRPFVRPQSGIDQDGLSLIYEDIRFWRARLKSINCHVTEAQDCAYLNVSEGENIKGWLLIGRGLDFISGTEIIEGRSKSDIRWCRLQSEGAKYGHLSSWISVFYMGIILGACLIAVTGLALSNAPNVSHIITFLHTLTGQGLFGASLTITFIPAIFIIFLAIAGLLFVQYAASHTSAVSNSASQLSVFKATFYLFIVVISLWVVAVGSVLYASEAIASGSNRVEMVAEGSIYVGGLVLAVVITAAAVLPALLLLRPHSAWKCWKASRVAITPRQRFKALYPASYNPVMIMGSLTLSVAFAAMYAIIFPLIGIAVVAFQFLLVIVHRYLVSYVYCQVGVGEQGGLLQIWIIRQIFSIISLQPLLLGLLLLSRRLWIFGGVLTGAGTFLLLLAEGYAVARMRLSSGGSLPPEGRSALAEFKRAAQNRSYAVNVPACSIAHREQGSLNLRDRLIQARSRGSLASILEMMSITLASKPPHVRRLPVPLETDDFDDLLSTERAARTAPSAPPHLPPLPFEDRTVNTSAILYAPEMLAESPLVWLPNDRNGVALAEAYDLQRYHDLGVVLDCHR